MAEFEGKGYYDSILKGLSSYSVFRRVGRLINWLADILAIAIPIFTYLWFSQQKDLPAIIAIIILGLLSGMFVVILLIEEWRWSEKARYAEATKSIHLCVHVLRDIHFSLPDEKISNKDRIQSLSFALYGLSKTFSLLKAVHCRACIKFIRMNDDVLKKNISELSDEERLRYFYVETLCRDMETDRKRDFRAEGDAKDNTLGGNTDFREIFLMAEGASHCWLRNDIWKDRTYQNTRLAGIKDRKQLGYRSALVVPIRKTTQGRTHVKQFADNQDIIGFVCIDSKTKGIFNERYDPEVASIFADAFFMLMKDWFK